MRVFITLFTFFLAFIATSQNAEDFKWPENEITPIFKEFVKAYNSNDIEKLESFTTKHYEKDFVKNAAYWPSVFADYGQIQPFKEAKEWEEKNDLNNLVVCIVKT